MGDRPPLLGALTALMALASDQQWNFPFWHYQLFASALNALFLIPIIYICSKLLRSSKAGVLVGVFLFCNSFIFLNIYYTWPKLFGAYLVLIALAIILDEKQRERLLYCIIAGTLCGLASLAHGGAALSLPMLVIFYMLLILKKKKFNVISYGLVFTLSFGLTQIPWNLYKKAHPEINTQNLLYDHYYPGAQKGIHYSETARKDLEIFLSRENSIEKQLRQRLPNILKLKNTGIREETRLLAQGKFDEYFRASRKTEFLYPLATLGVIPLILGVLSFSHCIRNAEEEQRIKITEISLLFGMIFCSYVLNASLKWSQPRNHELPYFELLLLLSLMSGLTFRVWRKAGALDNAVMAAQ